MPGTAKSHVLKILILLFLVGVYAPVRTMDLGSGIDTDKIIHQLLEVEARPIKKFEREIEEAREKKKALEALQSRLEDLNEKASELYGFRASFSERAAVSSNPDIVDATASRHAAPGERNIIIKQLASKHKISTDRFSSDHELSAGTFEISSGGDSYTIRFRGGALSALNGLIQEEASDIVHSELVRTIGADHLITIEALNPGKDGKIILTGDDDFLKEAGLIQDKTPEEYEGYELLFDRRFFSRYEGEQKVDEMDGSLEISGDGKTAEIRGVLWQTYTLEKEIEITEDTVFQFDLSYSMPDATKEMLDVPGRIEVGPEEKINIKGIELRGYNVPRIRPEYVEERKEFDSIIGAGIIYEENGVLMEKIYPLQPDAEGMHKLPVGNDMAGKKPLSVIFYCNEGTAAFNDAVFRTPLDDEEEFEFKNIIAEARNALLELDGIEIERDANRDLTDVINGLSLDLKRVADETVIINIDHDIEDTVQKIREFVESYNNYINIHRKLTQSEIKEKPGRTDRGEGDTGLFMGDSTLMRLESSIRRTITDSYSSRAEQPVRLLVQLGVSTGEVNADWQAIKKGTLRIDEARLTEILRENPEGAAMFFGADTTGDQRVDSGMAFSLVQMLKPYLGPGRSIISSKIDFQDTSIEEANNRIDKHYRYLEAYEERLRKKFGNMERSIGGAKQQQQWLEQQMQQNRPGGR